MKNLIRIPNNEKWFLALNRGENVSLILFVLVSACFLELGYYNSPHNMTNIKRLSISDLPDLMTLKEVSNLLRVSTLTLKRWGKNGKLPAIRINSRGDRRFKKDEVLKILEG
jgi:excisionase family DNA binding protein